MDGMVQPFQNIQPVIDSVIGDSREWINEIDDDLLADLVTLARRHDEAMAQLRQQDFGE